MAFALPLALVPALAPLAAAAFIVAVRPDGPRAMALSARAGAVAAVLAIVLAALAAAGHAPTGRIAGLDGLGAVLTVLVAGLGWVVARFSERAMRADLRLTRFAASISAATGAMLVAVVAADAILLLAAWVAGDLLLAALIGHAAERPEAPAAAARARTTFLIGDAAVAAGLAVLAVAAGSTSLPAMIAAAGEMPPAATALAAGLILVGALARSAALPFSGWLLSSLAAPTPVSALMHAGLVNAGGFLLIRFSGVLGAAPEVMTLAVVAGACTAVAGMAIMLVQGDVKRALAASTVAQMGFMILQCGLGAFSAALWHIVAHGLFKAWLFLTAPSAVGATPRPVRTGTGAALAAAAVGLLAGGAAVALGVGSVGSVFLGALAVTAAAQAVLGAFAARIGAADRLVLAGLVAVAAALHVAGLALAAGALGADHAASSPVPAVEVALALLFTGLFVAQARGLSLPPGLYVRLINVGRLRPAA